LRQRKKENLRRGAGPEAVETIETYRTVATTTANWAMTIPIRMNVSRTRPPNGERAGFHVGARYASVEILDGAHEGGVNRF
jgi:hypothetical protein